LAFFLLTKNRRKFAKNFVLICRLERRKKLLRLSELLPKSLTETTLPAITGDLAVTGLSEDSRKIRAGHLFFAIAGTKSDGRQFCQHAVDAGAIAVITDNRDLDDELDALMRAGTPVIQTPNPRRVLARAAAKFWPRQPSMIAAVTGTNGKTSTAEFLRQIWKRVTWDAASLGTLGVQGTDTRKLKGKMIDLPSLTTPDAISLHSNLHVLASAGITHLALEASSHGLEQYRLDGLNIHVAAFTNLTRDHLDHHHDMDTYFAAKARLFTDILMHAGVAVINIDDPYGRKLAEMIAADTATPRVLVTLGFAKDADFRIIKIEPVAGLLQMLVSHRDDDWHIPLALSGTFQAMNALTAAIMGHMSGLPLQDSLHAIAFLKAATGRMQTVSGHPYGAQIVVDYAHTPDALAAALAALRPEVTGRLVVLFGCGGDRDPGKRPMMGEIANAGADMIFVTDDNPRSEDASTIRSAIIATCPNAVEIAGRDRAIATAIGELANGDVLLIAGKGHETVQLIGDETLPFSDANVAHNAISTLIDARQIQAVEAGGG
jgi:UDP-N-acetylmuramoyl-L-alanyl-D-glutamate--2,6-diaminopimelate ligase